MTVYTKREQELMSQAFDEGVEFGHKHAEAYWRCVIEKEQAKEKELK